jgi:hypothetical protein
MKTATRILILAGAGLMSGAVIGVGPAQAATSTVQGAAGQSASQVQARDRDDDDVIGYYRSERFCERIGRSGEWSDRWEDYDCEYVWRGRHRGMWKLEVDRGWNWHDNDGDNDGGHGGHDGGQNDDHPKH